LSRAGNQSPFLTSNNIAYRATVLKNVGGFDERFIKVGGEERALNLKILNAGGKSIYASDIVVEHMHQMNFSKFMRQQLNYGRGAYVLNKIVGKELQSKSKYIPFSAYIMLACSLFKENVFIGLIKCAIFFIGQTFVTIGFCLQALKEINMRPHE
jgi:GT2 family glycosyltransferase